MKAKLAIAIASAVFASPVLAQFSSLDPIQSSHIEANVPAEENFGPLLQRDLLSYFKASHRNATAVEYQLLRTAPTQSGVAYPKYYAWVRVVAGDTPLQEGAVRVAAVAKTHFEVTDFMSAQSIKASPNHVASVFPAALTSSIIARAGARNAAQP